MSVRSGRLGLRHRTAIDSGRKNALPYPIRRGTVYDGLDGSRRVWRVSNGWLVSFDRGSQGGSLWFLSNDGRTEERLLARTNVYFYRKVGNGILLFTGVATDFFIPGDVYLVTLRGDRWRVRHFAILGREPDAVVDEPGGSFVVLTSENLFHVTRAGIRLLADVNTVGLYANSMVQDSQGNLFVGMRHYLLRLAPRPDGTYEPRWYERQRCVEPFPDHQGAPRSNGAPTVVLRQAQDDTMLLTVTQYGSA